MLHVFGLSLPSTQPLDRELVTMLAGRISATAASLQKGHSAAVAGEVRRDAQRYLAARRRGGVRFAAGAGRSCDEGVLALMRLTVDAPPMVAAPVLLVA